MQPGILRLLLVCIGLILPLCGGAADRLEAAEFPRDKVICFALYTVNNNILKMTGQLYPLKPDEDRTVRLEIKQDGRWKQIARAKVIEDGWTAPFRVENWDTTKDIEYRLAHGKNAYYTGTIRKDPVDKDTIVVVAFTGNSISRSAEISGTLFATSRRLQFPTTMTLVIPTCGVRAAKSLILGPATTEDTPPRLNTSGWSNAPRPATCPTPMTPRPYGAASVCTIPLLR
ncbi:MAG: hypothetical protein ACYS4W_08230 [Planctomycetota bacterium]